MFQLHRFKLDISNENGNEWLLVSFWVFDVVREIRIGVLTCHHCSPLCKQDCFPSTCFWLFYPQLSESDANFITDPYSERCMLSLDWWYTHLPIGDIAFFGGSLNFLVASFPIGDPHWECAPSLSMTCKRWWEQMVCTSFFRPADGSEYPCPKTGRISWVNGLV